jgi:DNA-binding NarL/FixJ family response regulator
VTPELRAIHEDRQPRRLTVCDPVDSGPPRGATAPSGVARVLVAHDKAVVRAGFRALLERDRRLSVVGEAATGEEAVSRARLLRPDVVMIDATVPGLDSVELATRPVPDCPDPDLVDELTAREREVVALVGHGLDNADIAERLVVTPATAKSHVSHAMLKVGATDRAKLVVFAYEAGLVVPRVEAPLAA